MVFNEEYHTKNRAEWIVNLYLDLDRFIMNLKTGTRKEFLQTYIKFSFNGLLFCYIMIRERAESLRIWCKVPYSDLKGAMPLFVRDYEAINRRAGVMITFDDQREFLHNKEAMLEVAYNIIRQSFQRVVSRKRKITPLKLEGEPVKPTEIFKPTAVNIEVSTNGYLNINLKIHKSKKKLLDRILQETIFK